MRPGGRSTLDIGGTGDMGARGPKPKPTVLRVLEGNPGRRPINKDEPRPTGEAAIPLHLTVEARDVWLTVVGSMPPGFYTAADEAVLTAFCEAAGDHARATSELKKSPQMVTDGKPNPLIRVRNDAARVLAMLGGRLGLSPADRTGLTSCAPQSENSWTRFIASSRSSKG